MNQTNSIPSVPYSWPKHPASGQMLVNDGSGVLKWEDVKTSVSVDGNAAVAIADKWIRFKYVEHFTCLAFMVVLFVVLPVWFMSKTILKKRE